MKIYLVRHAETDWNKNSRIQGCIDVNLNEKGEQEAKKASEFFSDIMLSAVYTSTLRRAITTARIIAPNNSNLIQSTKLDERNYGDWEGRLWREVRDENPSLELDWKQQGENHHPPNGESPLEMITRSYNYFKEIVKNHSLEASVLVVSHGGPIKGILGRINGLSDSDSLGAYSLDNCGISKVVIDKCMQVEFINYVVK